MQPRLLNGILVVIFCLAIYSSISCLSISNANFRSQQAHSAIVMLPNSDTDPVEYNTYYPTLSFRYGTYIDTQSDSFTPGSYVCRFGRIFASSSAGEQISASYDPFTGVLTWDGALYQNLAQPQGVADLLLASVGLLIALLIREVFRRGWL